MEAELHDRSAEEEGTSEKTEFKFRLLPPSSSSSSTGPPSGDIAVALEAPDFSRDAESILEDYQMALAGPTFEALQRHRPDLFQLVGPSKIQHPYICTRTYSLWTCMYANTILFNIRHFVEAEFSHECFPTRRSKNFVESLQKFGLCAAMCGDGSKPPLYKVWQSTQLYYYRIHFDHTEFMGVHYTTVQ